VKPFFVYLMRCGDGSYYCGHTDDLALRLQQHEDGDIGYTSTRKPTEIVWQGEFETREGALAFELQVKGWSRAKKVALIRGDWDAIKDLAKSTNSFRTNPAVPVQVEPIPLVQVKPIPPVRAELVEAFANPSTSSGRMDGEATQTLRPFDKLRTGQAQDERVVVQSIVQQDGIAQRRAIAKAITLLESTRADHRAQADELLTSLLPHTGKSFRLGISGVPGVGKSTFIETLGLYLIEQGHRVAVLTIDPSSTISGGSILGDKTRMEKLSVQERAYIRPSPSSGTLGGVAEKTREAMLVCEAAGYDIVIVETVGVGQSETAVAGMTDMFVLMQLPNAGDDLQAIKKGVMELADLVVINKADIDKDAATRAQAQITSAMRLFGQQGNPARKSSDPINPSVHPEPVEGFAMTSTSSVRTEDSSVRTELVWSPKVMQLSALYGTGVKEFWQSVSTFKDLQATSGKLAQRRQQQSLAWMWERIETGLKQAFKQSPQVQALLPQLTQQVLKGELAASTAARNLLAAQ
jgi:LAO/AO transport system kinase